ncbi:hypothetical protein Bca4012_102668 [Brassica carinata]
MDGAEARDLYRPSGQSQASMSRSAAVAAKPRSASRRAASVQILPAHPGSGSAVGSSGWKSTPRRVVSVHSAALENPEDECAHAGRTHNASGLQVRTRRLLAGCLSASVASGPPRVGGGGLGAALWELSRAALNVKVKKFNQARVNGGSNYDSLKPRAGLAESAGKEDPVELDSSPTFTNTNRESVAYRSFRSSEFEARGVRKVTTGITGLWQPSVHSGVAFDPSMSALPIIVKQNSPSVGLFTHQ